MEEKNAVSTFFNLLETWRSSLNWSVFFFSSWIWRIYRTLMWIVHWSLVKNALLFLGCSHDKKWNGTLRFKYARWDCSISEPVFQLCTTWIRLIMDGLGKFHVSPTMAKKRERERKKFSDKSKSDLIHFYLAVSPIER